ncbi:MAG: Dabb family protein [Actinomycetota bacterium]
MIQHTVALTWNDSVPPRHADACVEVLMTMSRVIHTIREYRCGPDLGLSFPTSADFVIVATFDDVDGWRHYDQHPMHNEIRAKYFMPYVASRTAGQFSF